MKCYSKFFYFALLLLFFVIIVSGQLNQRGADNSKFCKTASVFLFSWLFSLGSKLIVQYRFNTCFGGIIYHSAIPQVWSCWCLHMLSNSFLTIWTGSEGPNIPKLVHQHSGWIGVTCYLSIIFLGPQIGLTLVVLFSSVRPI